MENWYFDTKYCTLFTETIGLHQVIKKCQFSFNMRRFQSKFGIFAVNGRFLPLSQMLLCLPERRESLRLAQTLQDRDHHSQQVKWRARFTLVMIRKITCRNFPNFWFQTSPQVGAIRTVVPAPKTFAAFWSPQTPPRLSQAAQSDCGRSPDTGLQAQIVMILDNYYFLYWNKSFVLLISGWFFPCLFCPL